MKDLTFTHISTDRILLPLLCQDEVRLLCAYDPVLMHKSDTGIQLVAYFIFVVSAKSSNHT